MGHPQVNGHMPLPKANQTLTQLNEQAWVQVGEFRSQTSSANTVLISRSGTLADLMGDLDGALQAYEHALRHQQWSVPAMTGIATILRTREQFAKAVEYLQNILKIDANNGEIWGSLGIQQRSHTLRIAYD